MTLPDTESTRHVTVARLSIDPNLRVGAVTRQLFGSFVEHMGRSVYGGVYDPEDPSATSEGFRADVIELAKEMGVGVVRYPGGNFVSGYLWEDGIGPKDKRPTRLDLAWRSIETNQFGLNEFMSWIDKVNAEPMMATNLGTRGVLEAAHLLEYCNYGGQSALSDMRRQHGVEKPHEIKLWCLGNELDGPWQIGHKTADEYGRLAQEAAKAMRLVDPDISLVVCGSSFEEMPTFGTWERTVLRHAFDEVDLISLHVYYEKYGDDSASFLASSARMDRFIKGVIAAADEVAAEKQSTKQINLSFDEWNVWYQKRFEGVDSLDWEYARRLIEDEFTVEDAVVVGSMLMTLLNNTDRIDVACQAQLVNVIGPIRTEPGHPAWRQTIFYPFALTARHAKGDVLLPKLDCDRVSTKLMGDVPVVDAMCSYDEDSGALVMFLLNRSTESAVTVESNLSAFGDLNPLECVRMGGGGLERTNTLEHPFAATPELFTVDEFYAGTLRVSLPPVSWNMIRLVKSES